jgi:hypothetical protein
MKFGVFPSIFRRVEGFSSTVDILRRACSAAAFRAAFYSLRSCATPCPPGSLRLVGRNPSHISPPSINRLVHVGRKSETAAGRGHQSLQDDSRYSSEGTSMLAGERSVHVKFALWSTATNTFYLRYIEDPRYRLLKYPSHPMTRPPLTWI